MIAVLLALVLTTDRAPLADEWGYRPAENSKVEVNPPSLTWVHEKGATGYDVQWASTPDLNNATTIEKLRWPVYTHNKTFQPGQYWWRYRLHDSSGASAWSKARTFTVPPSAAPFPQPTMAELKERIPQSHPRLFVSDKDLPRLREWAKGGGANAWAKLQAKADQLLAQDPTPEPAVKATPYDPATNKFWWSNRLQSIKALNEAEVLAFVYLMTGDKRYGERARDFTVKLLVKTS